MKINLNDKQKNILMDVVEVYNRNLSESLTMLHTSNPDQHMIDMMELVEEIRGDSKNLIKGFESDFFKYCDVRANPELINDLTLFDLMIIKFILTDFEEDYNWDNLALGNLISQLDFIISNHTNSNSN